MPAAAIARKVRALDPGCFALVMATGIVSIDAAQHDMGWLARALFALNAAAFACLLAASVLRLAAHPRRMAADFADPRRAPGFLTLVAATCVLGSQCLVVIDAPRVAMALAIAAALLWPCLLYPLFAVAIARRHKPGFTRAIHGGWLVCVVATQALAALLVQLSPRAAHANALLFAGVCLFLVGAGLYLLIIMLIVYRLMVLPLRAADFRAPYWIDMGALAITALAGSLIVQHVPGDAALQTLLPFVRGLTLLAWAAASAWIPLLALLEFWRHAVRRVPLRYEADDWDIVFPIGMYTVGTFVLAHALGFGFLLVVPALGVHVGIAAWLLVMIGMLWQHRPARRA